MTYSESNGHVLSAVSRKQLGMLFSNNRQLLPSLL